MGWCSGPEDSHSATLQVVFLKSLYARSVIYNKAIVRGLNQGARYTQTPLLNTFSIHGLQFG